MDRVLALTNDERSSDEKVVDETLQAIIEYIEAAERHFEISHPDSSIVLSLLIAEIKRDFEIHD
jgi:hypothetical protein